MELTQEDLMEAATSTQRPIAGQSLVEDPATSSPYTNPPKFTNKEEAIDFFIESFLEPSRYQAIMDSLEEGTPVMELVQLFLVQSFKEGDIKIDNISFKLFNLLGSSAIISPKVYILSLLFVL